MRWIVMGLGALTLAGCTTSGLSEKEPAFVGVSKKSPVQYSRCLAPKWQDFNPGTTSVETETGVRIVASATYNGVVAMATADQTPQGTRVAVRLPAQWIPGTGGWITAAQNCL